MDTITIENAKTKRSVLQEKQTFFCFLGSFETDELASFFSDETFNAIDQTFNEYLDKKNAERIFHLGTPFSRLCGLSWHSTTKIVETNGQKREKFFLHEKIRQIVTECTDVVEKSDEKITKLVIIFSNKFSTIFGENGRGIFLLSKIIASTCFLSSYQFTDFITDDARKKKSNYTVYIGSTAENCEQIIDCGIKNGNIVGNAVNQARRWGDMPPNLLNPSTYKSEITNFFSSLRASCDIRFIEKEELKKLSCGGIIAVCEGSKHDPFMGIVSYTPAKKSASTKRIVIVGKGVTFDTGGISIKPADNMEDMKDDMAGSAVALAIVWAAAKLEIPHEVIAVVPVVENMPGGNACRPGDIITFYNGKTAEIKNTDAEGRLILADALSYASDKLQPDILIDFATLTGACSVALGPFFAAIMGKNKDLMRQLQEVGDIIGERCWELPLDDLFFPGVESEIADLCNIGKKNYRAGTIIGGCFLKHFVKDITKWAHIDIANVSMHPVGRPYLKGCGATGFGVQLITSFVSQIC